MTMMIPQREDQTSMHYDPQKLGRLADAVIVLRKVNRKKLMFRATPTANTAWELIGSAQVQLHVREDQLPWYEQDYLVNDQPRDEKVARDIARATIGFAVARSDNGEILETFGIEANTEDGLQKALLAATTVAGSARLSLIPQLKTIIPEPEDHEALIAKFLEREAAKDESPADATQEA